MALRYEFEPTVKPDLAAGKGVPGPRSALHRRQPGRRRRHAAPVPNIFSTEGLTCGYDGGSRVAPDHYDDGFAFTGRLERVTIDVSGDLIADTENEIRVAMARQ